MSAPVLRYYDASLPVLLSVDASMKGLGCVLLQEEQPIAYTTKALYVTEQNYAQIEKEMLAIVFGCERMHQYIYGHQKVTVETDHKPLEVILKKHLNKAPMRLQKMILRIQPYTIKVVYRPGTTIPVADALSRAPAVTPGNPKSIMDESV